MQGIEYQEIHLDVNNSPQQATLFICEKCGAVVLYKEVHNKFHFRTGF